MKTKLMVTGAQADATARRPVVGRPPNEGVPEPKEIERRLKSLRDKVRMFASQAGYEAPAPRELVCLRYAAGLDQMGAAERMQVDPRTWRAWEAGRRVNHGEKRGSQMSMAAFALLTYRFPELGVMIRTLKG